MNLTKIEKTLEIKMVRSSFNSGYDNFNWWNAKAF